ncbi:unnamed protein product [Ranitomeya imitator]|uniref:ribonuclease H n=1 Tax=Ranitomeya imitator TaxID=111125 RepID=A0ABN9MPQ1_9NEOB|nr:unnamed protein product [Ranitomeya imitator]
MDIVLAPHRDYASAYLDDIVIFSTDWDTHLSQVQAVLESLRAAGLTANPKKCAIGLTEARYLGYVIGRAVIKPQVNKIEAIQNWPKPLSSKQVRAFLGIIGYYRRFIPNFAGKSASLTDLLKGKKTVMVKWNPQAEEAFQSLKSALCGQPVLISPDFKKTFIVQTDASEVGLGAVLSQEVNGDEHPVTYLSRKLTPAEKNYSVVEKECLAIKWALESLRYYLLGRQFRLVTDHSPLVWMRNAKERNARVTRWFLSLQNFSFSVEHRAGKSQGNADVLSRAPYCSVGLLARVIGAYMYQKKWSGSSLELKALYPIELVSSRLIAAQPQCQPPIGSSIHPRSVSPNEWLGEKDFTVLQNNAKYQVVPKKLTIGKRLAQCLHPALPGGVHRKALETYEIIFKIIGPKRLAKDLFLYSAGLFPLLTNAAMSVKPALLSLYEIYYLPLGKTLKPGLQGLLTGILPGLEEGSEYYDRTNTLLEKVASAVEQSAFYSALWGSLLTSPAVRLPGITYVLSHLNRKLSMEDQLYIIGSDIELMVEAVSTSVQDASVLVQRSTLDLILFCFPFHMSQATRPDMIRILSAALHVVLRRDMSLNRRLYAWLLGFDNNGTITGPRSTRQSNPEEHASYYFNTFSKDLLVQAMVGILQGKELSREKALMQDLKPFRILISLLDKPELGPAILEDVLIEVFRTLYTQCKAELDLQTQAPFSKDPAQLSSKLRENKRTAELIKTANLLFNSFEPYYMWDYIARWFEECCRRTQHARLQPPSDGGNQSELPLINFCLLVDFLLDIVSLETYIEIQTEHLPQLLLRMISALTSHLQALDFKELTDSLRLCSKILSKVQPPLLSAGTEGSFQLSSGQNGSGKDKEDGR